MTILGAKDYSYSPMPAEVAVGDLKSDARGTGARKNAGKPQWWQIPWFAAHNIVVRDEIRQRSLSGVIFGMAQWQRGDDAGLDKAAADLTYLLAYEQKLEFEGDMPPLRALESTVAVLEFGAKKYPACDADKALDKNGRPTPASAGNWAKGMPWSVCFSCAMSHLTAATGGEFADAESGISHLAHAMCNILFLLAYRDLYPEGDDRITQYRLVEK